MRAAEKKMKPKECKACKREFTPRNSMQKACSIPCSLEIVKADNARKEKRELKEQSRQQFQDLRARKERLKTRRDHMREAQKEFNLYIRLRDQLAGYPCISSGKPLDWNGNDVDAGHYRSTGAAPHLRFNELNCHAQSKQENRWLSGNAADYRVGLIARIGLEAVETLEADNSERRYTVDDLKAIKEKYRAMARELKKRLE